MSVTAEQILKVIDSANVVKDVNDLNLDLALSEQGMDSLDFSAILFNFEEEFGIEILDEDIDGLQTINQIVVYVNSKV